jgi:outer membrane protein
MKNGLLIWNIILTAIAGYLLFTHFSPKKNTVSGTSKTFVKDTPAGSSSFRIAYFEMDSVEKNYQMVKDVQSQISTKEKNYNNDLAQLDWTFKKKYEGYQQKASSMSQDDYEKAKIDLKQLEDELKVQKQELDQQYQDFVMRKQLSLKNAIEDFLKEYNKEKSYSYIFANERGFFYYCDTTYDITGDVIKGLNEMYKSKKE